MLRKHDEHIIDQPCVTVLVRREEQFVELLAWPYANDLSWHARRNRLGQVDHSHGWDPWNEDLTSTHVLERVEHKVDRLWEGDPEPRHSLIRDADGPPRSLVAKD